MKKRALLKSKFKVAKESTLQERRFGVLLEHMDSNFKLVLEGHAALDKKIEDFRYETRNDISFIKFALNTLTSKIEDLETRFNRFEDNNKSDHKSILEYLARIDDEIAGIKSKIDKKADLERVIVLEKRVAVLSSKVRS